MSHLQHLLRDYELTPFTPDVMAMHQVASKTSDGVVLPQGASVSEPKDDFAGPIELPYEPNRGSSKVSLEHVNQRVKPLDERVIGRQSIARSAIVMILFLILGLASAIGHHAFYNHLNGRATEGDLRVGNSIAIPSQVWVFRVGTAFVFLTKTLFSASVSAAFTQRLWLTMNRKYMRLSGLDAMWAVLSDPQNFTSWDMLKHAKVLTSLALIAWLIPLASIPAPGTLTTVTRISSLPQSCMIPSVDLTNVSVLGSYAELDPLRFYDGSTPFMESLAVRIISSSTFAPWSSPCGPNCSYSTSFDAPAYSCSEAQSYGYDTVLKYLATEYSNLDQDNMTITWVGNANSSNAGPGDPMMITTCLPYNTTYGITVLYNDGVQSVNVDTMDQHDPIATANMTYGAGEEPVSSDSTMIPKANSAGIKDALSKFLVGFISYGPSSGYNVNNTLVGYSNLVNWSAIGSDKEMQFQDVPSQVEQLMRNMSISLMANSPSPLVGASCRVTTSEIVYQYDRGPLFAGYGASFGATLIAVCIGIHALFALGGGGTRSFSLLVATTRNRDLDEAFEEAEVYEESSRRLKGDLFMYGAVEASDNDENPRFSFKIKKS